MGTSGPNSGNVMLTETAVTDVVRRWGWHGRCMASSRSAEASGRGRQQTTGDACFSIAYAGGTRCKRTPSPISRSTPDDPKKLADFYTKMFDWKATEMPEMDYIVVHSGDTDDKGMLAAGAINGGIARRPDGFKINGAVNYSMVDSIEDSVERARCSGPR